MSRRDLLNVTDEQLVQELLIRLGEDPNREGLKETPRRFIEAMKELTGQSWPYKHPTDDRLDARLGDLFKTFDVAYDELVVVRRIEFTSLCEHHLLPFQGHVHVGYLPDGKVLGLSKFARVVDWFAKRLQVQERLTEDIANAIQEHLKPKGVGVVIEAEHFCMKIRGVKKQDAVTMTSSVLGLFRSDQCVKKEFFDLVFRR